MADKPSGLVDRSSFLASIRGDTAGGAWLLEGEEDNLKDEAIALIREKYLPEGLEELNEAALTAPDTDEIIAACETIPFMADKRLVIVRDLPGLAGQRETDDRLADYIPHVPDTCVLLLLLHGYANGAKKLPKAIGKKRRVDFCPMGDAEVSAWIIRRIRWENAGDISGYMRCSFSFSRRITAPPPHAVFFSDLFAPAAAFPSRWTAAAPGRRPFPFRSCPPCI